MASFGSSWVRILYESLLSSTSHCKRLPPFSSSLLIFLYLLHLHLHLQLLLHLLACQPLLLGLDGALDPPGVVGDLGVDPVLALPTATLTKRSYSVDRPPVVLLTKQGSTWKNKIFIIYEDILVNLF